MNVQTFRCLWNNENTYTSVVFQPSIDNGLSISLKLVLTIWWSQFWKNVQCDHVVYAFNSF